MVTGAQPGTPTYETVTAGPPHARQFAVRALFDTTTITATAGEGGWPEQIVGDWHVSATKKTAEQQALWDVLGVISGHQMSADPAHPAPLRGTADTATTDYYAVDRPGADNGEGAVSASVGYGASAAHLPPGWTPAMAAAVGSPAARARKRTAARSNPISWLLSFAAAIDAGEPDIETTETGSAQTPRFAVTYSVGPGRGVGTGRTIKAAKRAAAMAAVEDLFGQADAAR